MKKTITLFVAVLIIALLASFAPGCATSAPTGEDVRIPMLGATFGTGTYNFLVALERLSADHPWMHLIATETPGYLWNTEELVKKDNRWENTIIGSGTDTILMGKMGMEPFFSEPLPPAVDDLKVLATFQVTNYALATTDPNIKSVYDLDGKKVGLGRTTQISWGVKPTLMIEAAGVDADLEYVGSGPSMEALLDGRVDAAHAQFYSDGAFEIINPHSNIAKLAASGKDYHFFGYPEEVLEKAAADTGLEFLPRPVPAGTLEGQDEDLLGCHHTSTLWVHQSFPDDTAAEFARFMMENYKEFPKFTAGAKTAVPATFVYSFKETQFHPAAAKVYQDEYGLTIAK
jgi:TRAP transporter TAXI family solute receptor